MERRAFSLELRAARGNPRRLEGYAATFGVDTQIGNFVETIRAGAFAESLASGRDVLALVDHAPDKLLARTRSGSLRLSEDSRGLAFDISLPQTSLAHDVLALAERGDIGGMSFGFKAKDERWSGDRRELRAVELHEISIVSAWPAYENTVVEARSRRRSDAPDAGLRRALERWRA